MLGLSGAADLQQQGSALSTHLLPAVPGRDSELEEAPALSGMPPTRRHADLRLAQQHSAGPLAGGHAPTKGGVQALCGRSATDRRGAEEGGGAAAEGAAASVGSERREGGGGEGGAGGVGGGDVSGEGARFVQLFGAGERVSAVGVLL